MVIVDEIIIPHHAMPKPSRSQTVFRRNLEFCSTLRLLVSTLKRLFEDIGSKDLPKEIVSDHPLVMPCDAAAGLLKRREIGFANARKALQDFVMQLEKCDMKL